MIKQGSVCEFFSKLGFESEASVTIQKTMTNEAKLVCHIHRYFWTGH